MFITWTKSLQAFINRSWTLWDNGETNQSDTGLSLFVHTEKRTTDDEES